ncbi:MAG: AAA family ATPase, partial [Patescibacteria group bacterium]
MDNPDTNTAIVCAACGGDPRTSVDCKMCGGAGIGVASPDGFLVWSEPVDSFSIALRKLKIKSLRIFHIFLLFVILSAVALQVWKVFNLEDVSTAATLDFWSSGGAVAAFFWFGLLVACFLFFHFIEFSSEAKNIPTWQLSGLRLAEYDAAGDKRREHSFDIAPYFSKEAMDIVETAYRITSDLKRTQIMPEMIFAAALTTLSGGMVMARVGMNFNSIKEKLAKLMLDASSAGSPPIMLSKESKRTLALSYADARREKRKNVGGMELFLQSFKDSAKVQSMLDAAGFSAEYVFRAGEWVRLQQKLREDHLRFIALAALKPKTTMNRAMTAVRTPLLDRFSEDLTLLARSGYLAPMIGREREFAALLQGVESGRRSVVLIGETGVGKSAMMNELARRMVEEDVPTELFDRRLVQINLSQLVASGESGLAKERLMAMLDEVAISGNIILAVDGLESLTGGSDGGPMDLAEMFAAELDKGYFIAIAATTPAAWTQYLERRTLGSKLVKVIVLSLSEEDTVRVLMAKSGAIEVKNKVFFSYSALDKAASLALRYIHDTAAPQNALDIIREAAVLARKNRGEKTFVTAEDVSAVVHAKTNIPVEAVGAEESEKLLNLESRLHQRIIGQDEAVTAVAQALRRARAELREGKRPIANFLFLGPTGVGKTELSKALAAEYFGDEKMMVRLDMSEYQDAASVARMIGAAGDERGGLLTEAVRKNPFSIVLLDEIEKAHPDILNLFLQVMDDGRLTDGIGRTVDFTNAMVIMTSNAATAYVQAEVAAGTPLPQIRTALLERE